MTDWENIRLEYISGNLSMRQLADKHGVTFSALKNHAVKDGWKKQRELTENKVRTKTEQKLVNAAVKDRVSKTQLIDDTITELLIAARKAVGQLDQKVVNGEVVDGLMIDTDKLSKISTVLQRAAEVIGYRSEDEYEGTESGVVILPPVMDREDTDNGHIRTDERNDR